MKYEDITVRDVFVESFNKNKVNIYDLALLNVAESQDVSLLFCSLGCFTNTFPSLYNSS